MRHAWPLVLVIAAAPAAAQTVERLTDGIALPVGDKRLELRVCRDDIVRVVYAPKGAFFARETMTVVKGACLPTEFEVQTGDGSAAVTTRKLTARVALPSGAVTFLDRHGRTLLAEKTGGGKTLTAATVMGESTSHVQAEFEPSAGEALYGLGAHQNGFMNYAGPRRRHVPAQHRRHRALPRVAAAATACCGTTRRTRSSATCKPAVHVPAKNLFDAHGQGRRASPAPIARATARRAPSWARASTRRSRSARPRTGPPVIADPPGAAGHEPADPPGPEGRRRLRRLGGRRSRARRPATTTS